MRSKISFLCVLIELLLGAPRAHAQLSHMIIGASNPPPPSRVQGCGTVTNAASATQSCTMGSAIGTGDLIIGAVACYCATAPTGVTVGGVAATLVDFDTHTGLQTFYLQNVTGSPTLVTATWATAIGYWVMAEDYANVATSGALDGHLLAYQTSVAAGANTITSGNVTPSQNGDLIYSVTAVSTGAIDEEPGTGFAALLSATTPFNTVAAYSAGFAQYYFGDESAVQMYAAVISGTFGTTTSGSNWATDMMAFKR